MNSTLKWKLVSGFLLVFVAGGMTGALVSAVWARKFSPPHHGLVAEHMRARLQRELRLSPDQVQKITPTIERSAAELERIRLASARRVRQTFDATHREISENLTDEQRQRLQRMRMRRAHWVHSQQPTPAPTATPLGRSSPVD